MKFNGILFILSALLIGQLGAMDEHIGAQEVAKGKSGPAPLKEQALARMAKKYIGELHSAKDKKKTLDNYKASQDYLQLPSDLHEPLLAEIGRQYYLAYGGQYLDAGVEYGFSIAELLKAGRLPKIRREYGGTILRLKLNDLRINNLEGLQQIPNIHTVQELDLSNNQINTIADKAFEGLNNLQTLYLNKNQISTIPTNALAGLNNLEDLYLSKNKISTIADNAFTGLNNLQHLHLIDNQIRTIADKAFVGLDNLQMLYLIDNQISSISDKAFEGLNNLEDLYLTNNQIRTIADKAFTGLNNLKWLNLADNQIRTIADKAFEGLDNLKFLNLHNNSLLPETKKHLKAPPETLVNF